VTGGQVLVTAARTYLGAVPGTGALIAIVTQGTSARGYLCDGTPGRAVTLADWFTGQVRDGTLDAVSGQHHVRLAARLGGRAVTGSITLPGAGSSRSPPPWLRAADRPDCMRPPAGCAA
jgi:hypothetical protein